MSVVTLSKETLALIKNFAGINGSIMFTAGNRLATISEGKNVMAETSIPETFPQNFGVYDLNEFLGVIGLFDGTKLDFQDKFVLISDGKGSSIKYFAAGESVVKPAPASIKFPAADVNFDLGSDQVAMILRTASVLKASDVTVAGDGSKLTTIVWDKKNDTSNAYTVDLGTTDETFKANFKVENFKMLPGDYSVGLSKKRISKFTAKTGDLTYYVAVEADSEFE